MNRPRQKNSDGVEAGWSRILYQIQEVDGELGSML